MSEATVERRSGLLNVVDIVVAPSTAFARLRLVPTWGWAFLAATLLAIAASLVMLPAMTHATQQWLPGYLASQKAISGLPAEQQSKVIAQQLAFSKITTQFQWVFVPVVLLVTGLLQALAMMVGNAVGHGDGTFRKWYALSMTVAIVGAGLNSVVIAIIVALRGPNAFDSPNALTAVAPSLAMLAPGLKGMPHGFLLGFNIFSLWSTALLAAGMQVVGRVPRLTAWVTAAAMLLFAALFTALSARLT